MIRYRPHKASFKLLSNTRVMADEVPATQPSTPPAAPEVNEPPPTPTKRRYVEMDEDLYWRLLGKIKRLEELAEDLGCEIRGNKRFKDVVSTTQKTLDFLKDPKKQ